MRKSLHSDRSDALLDMLRGARKRAGLTQVEVAQRLGRPQSFVAKYEGGERRLDVVELLEVAEALQADPVAMLRKLRNMSA
ncbi:MAG TPA: helix-turn-helix transcriptional regulator [Pirellulales bacterium]|jgi:transcriptional regulator with XRE-family HTH domain|nr:helix-turn-helix transcriptional regulator [Pirellulales bacterium]